MSIVVSSALAGLHSLQKNANFSDKDSSLQLFSFTCHVTHMFEADVRVKCYLARVIFDAGRPQEAASMILSLSEANYDFQGEDQTLVVTIWKDLISPLRYAIAELVDTKGHAPTAVASLKDALNKRLDEGIKFLSAFSASAADDKTRGVFLKTLGDFKRYKIDCVSGGEGRALGASAKENYQDAIETFRSLHQQCTELRVATQLNLAILMAEYLDDRRRACEALEKLHHDLTLSVDKYPEETRVRLNELRGLMEDNLKKWKPSDEAE